MGLTTIIIVNVVLSAIVVGAIVGSHLWAILASRDTAVAGAIPVPAGAAASTGAAGAVQPLLPELAIA